MLIIFDIRRQILKSITFPFFLFRYLKENILLLNGQLRDMS